MVKSLLFGSAALIAASLVALPAGATDRANNCAGKVASTDTTNNETGVITAKYSEGWHAPIEPLGPKEQKVDGGTVLTPWPFLTARGDDDHLLAKPKRGEETSG